MSLCYKTFAFLTLLVLAQSAAAATRIEILFDDSNSMQQLSANNKTYCEEAKVAVNNLLNQIRSAGDIINVELIVVSPLNREGDSAKSNAPSEMDRLTNYIQALECDGGTPLAEKIYSSINAHRESEADHMLFIFTDGENDGGDNFLASTITQGLSLDTKQLQDIKFYQVGRTEVSDYLNQNVKQNSTLGRRFSAVALSDMSQLNDSLKESMTQFINQELIKKLRVSIKDLSTAKTKQSAAEQIIINAEQMKLNSNTQVLDLVEELDSLKTELNELAKSTDVKLVSDQFADLFEKLRKLLAEGNKSLENLTGEISTLSHTLEAFSQVNLKIKDAEDKAAEALAYLLRLEQENAAEFAKLSSEQQAEIQTIKASLDEVIAKSNDLRARAASLELVIAEAKKSIDRTQDLFKTLTGSISSRVVALRETNGKEFDALLRKYLGEKGYTVLENGDLVYYGTHVFIGGGSGSGGSSSSNGSGRTVRNKGTMIFLGEPSGGGSGDGDFINEGTIIYAINKNAAGDGYTAYLSNGRTIEISLKDSNRLTNGYFWVATEGGYLVFSQDFKDVYFVSQKYVDVVRENMNVGTRSVGALKLVSTGIMSFFTITGSIIVDAMGNARSFVTDNGTASADLTTRNAEIAAEFFSNSWVQLTGERGVVSLPEAIVPVVLDIEAMTRK